MSVTATNTAPDTDPWAGVDLDPVSEQDGPYGVDEPIDLIPTPELDQLDELLLDLNTGEREALAEVLAEYLTAVERFQPFNSAHEGYAVLAEEVDELWEEVRAKQGARDMELLRKESVQVTAMGLRFRVEVAVPGGRQQ